MATRRLLKDAVVLYNYIGEVRDEATYQETILKNCYCTLSQSANLNMQGKKADDSARLYIFDVGTTAVDAEGAVRTFLPYNEWKALPDKSAYWTLSDKGTDYFKKVGTDSKMRLVGFSRKKAGSHRMWHYEVDGK